MDREANGTLVISDIAGNSRLEAHVAGRVAAYAEYRLQPGMMTFAHPRT